MSRHQVVCTKPLPCPDASIRQVSDKCKSRVRLCQTVKCQTSVRQVSDKCQTSVTFLVGRIGSRWLRLAWGRTCLYFLLRFLTFSYAVQVFWSFARFFMCFFCFFHSFHTFSHSSCIFLLCMLVHCFLKFFNTFSRFFMF